MLFSATFKKKIEELAREILQDPVRVVVGALGEANQDVTQHVEVFGEHDSKWTWRVVTLSEAPFRPPHARFLAVLPNPSAPCHRECVYAPRGVSG